MLRTAVLVVGGGPAGATAARFLADAGIDAIIAERDISYIKPCGGGIPSGGVREFDLPEEIIKRKIYKIVIVSPKNRRIEIQLKSGHICITERGALDATLRRIAMEKGASLIEGEFCGFDKDNGTYISSVRKKNDELLKIRSDYIIASDGITFGVGRKCGMQKPEFLYTISTHLRPFSADACEFWFGTAHASNFYSWLFPSDGTASVGTGSCNPVQLHTLLNNFLRRRFDFGTGDLSDICSIERPRVFPIPAWRGKPLAFGNILFLGDAAATAMPVTYEGIYYAMKSGQFAALAIRNKKPALYPKLWDDRFGRRFSVMNKFKDRFFRNDESIERWVGIHRSPAVQELALKLWLQKESGPRQLADYLKAFGSLAFP
ncbi:MAG TPA: geranylgeranyl reductase family protein [Dissulfurispiraceae bacterium]|nr:geranylgeranyl reductase family protein [Dissulfurispiraceae bacterium]